MKRSILLVLVLAFGLVTEQTSADFTFGELQNLGPVINSPSGDATICFSADSLELYFSSNRPGGYGYFDIYVTTRATKGDPWGPPLNLGPAVNTPDAEICPSISSDGLTLYFCDDWDWSPRPGGLGGCDIWMATRASRSASWGTPVNVGAPINTSANEISPMVCGDGLALVFASTRAGGQGSYDLWTSTRETTQDDWGEPVNIGEVVNSGSFDDEPSLSSDDRALVFTSQRPGGFGSYDLWMTTRKTPSDPWGPPVNLGPGINSSGHEGGAAISADSRMLYFLAHTPPGGFGGYDLWEAPIIPIVDFNADGMVAIEDLVRLIESWGKDDPSVDIGPGPWGDGTVDAADLEVFMSYWGQEVVDPALIDRWKLDETEGSVAQNSVSDNHGILHGEPLWQPVDGKKDGVLAFDGIDDYVETGFVLDPFGGAFSAFAWIKAGEPGQVIISQTDGPNGAGETWLGADTSDGKLMTGLRAPSGRSPAPPMITDAVITDGQWHHIGIVVTEQKVRHLYVDGIRVAFDTQPVLLPSSDGDLYIGAGKSLDTGTFFSGMIDDLRIYNKALSAENIEALAN